MPDHPIAPALPPDEAALRLGESLLAARQLDAAIGAFREALRLRPDSGPAYHRLGLALLDQGQVAQAIAAQRNAVRLMPQDAAAQVALGTALRLAGRAEQAVPCYETALALDPMLYEARFQLGNALASLGRADQAVIAYCAAIHLRPDIAQTHFNLAELLQLAGMLEMAADRYAAAAVLRSDFAQAHVNRGNCLLALGRAEAAAEAYRAALRIWPGYAIAHANLGSALHALGRFEEAEARQRAALRLEPDYADAHSNLGNALLVQGRFDEAIAAFRAALRLRPDFAEAHANLGAALRDAGDIAEALLHCEAAIELQPARPDARFNRALALLTAGRYEDGWAEHEQRLALPHYPKRDLGRPQWRGEPLEGRRILLHAEQGLGDTIQFVRFAPLVAALGGQVILAVQKPLAGLLSRVKGVAGIVACGETLPGFDLHCPMMSLPHALGTSLATIPAAPYLAADAARVQGWAARLPAGPGKRVGLVWAGSPRPNEPQNHYADRRRSLRLRSLAPLAGVPGVQFVSLQLGAPAAEAAAPPAGMALVDLTAEIADFEDTAALVAGLDLVIAVDTSVAHLAAAMGKPVWLLSRADACWRWLAGREDSPWYPGLRLFRQARPGEWGPVIARVAAELARFAGETSRAAA
jgi:tetratricopeptide (TPR) repeat protein